MQLLKKLAEIVSLTRLSTRVVPSSPPNASSVSLFPLSSVDNAIPKEWGELMSCKQEGNSISYSTSAGGSLKLSLTQAGVTISEQKTISAQKNISVSVVTPGELIRLEKATIPLKGSDIYLLITSEFLQDADAVAQTHLYFYTIGYASAGVDLLPRRIFSNVKGDMVKVSVESWRSKYDKKSIAFPAVTTGFPDWITSKVGDCVDILLERLTTAKRDPVKLPGNIASLPSFKLPSADQPSTILGYFNTLYALKDISYHLYKGTTTHVLHAIILGTVTHLMKMDQLGEFLEPLMAGYTLSGYELDDTTNVPLSTRENVARHLAKILNLHVDFPYREVEESASDIDYVTMTFMSMHNTSPYGDGVYRVNDDVDKEYPLPEIADKLLDPRSLPNYKELRAIIETDVEGASKALLIVYRRIRSTIKPDDLLGYVKGGLFEEYQKVDISLMKFKMEMIFDSDHNRLYSQGFIAVAKELDRAVEKGWLSVDPAPSMANGWGQYDAHISFATQAALRYITSPEERAVINALLNWLTPETSTFVCDVLDTIKFAHNIARRGPHQFPLDEAVKKAKTLADWTNVKYPGALLVTVSIPTAVSYGTYSPGWSSLYTLSFGAAAVACSGPIPGFDINNPQSIANEEEVIYLARAGPNDSLELISGYKKNTPTVIHISNGCAQSYKMTGGDGPKQLNLSKVSKGDFILVQLSGESATEIVNSVLNVSNRDLLRVILNASMTSLFDVLFEIN